MIAALGPAFIRVMTIILTLPFIAQALKSLGGGGGVVNSLTGAVYGPAQQTAPAGQPTSGQAVASSPQQTTSEPSFGSLIKDLTSQPLGAAALIFVSVFLIAQLRGAARDAGSGLEKSTKALKSGEL